MDKVDLGFIKEPDAIKLLKEFHIPYPENALGRNAHEASQIAERLGYPVVLKVVSSDVIHKSDAGGVQVNLANAENVQKAYQKILNCVLDKIPHARIDGILVCRQAPPGLEVIVGALKDLTFGPVIMFGLGGVFTEVLKDVSFRIVPLQFKDAEEMIGEIRGYSLLKGVRGQPPLDTDALASLLLNISHLMATHPEINELDLNPVRVYEHGLIALDVRLITRIGEDE